LVLVQNQMFQPARLLVQQFKWKLSGMNFFFE
jgi:hypothetical protein